MKSCNSAACRLPMGFRKLLGNSGNRLISHNSLSLTGGFLVYYIINDSDYNKDKGKPTSIYIIPM